MESKLLSARANNIFSITLLGVAIIYIIVVLASAVLSDVWSFIGLVIIGGFG